MPLFAARELRASGMNTLQQDRRAQETILSALSSDFIRRQITLLKSLLHDQTDRCSNISIHLKLQMWRRERWQIHIRVDLPAARKEINGPGFVAFFDQSAI